VYSLGINSLYTETPFHWFLKYRKNTDKSPVCSFQSNRIKLSLLCNKKANILQGKNSSSNIQSDQMNRRWILILLLLLLLLVAVTTNPLIKVPLLCRWCTRHLVAASHGRGCRFIAASRGRWWRTYQGVTRGWARPSNAAARRWCRRSMAAGRARPWRRSMADDDGQSMMASARRG
jgi:hypothetical protein